MQIIEKDITWLYDKIPDFKDFINDNQYLFDNNGFVAGGFLRKAISFGSAVNTIKAMQNSDISGDIDWFFRSPMDCEKAWHIFSTQKTKYLSHIKEPNSSTKFAFEGFSDRIRYQLIYKSYGKPETVLNRFDISNCKIATDGVKVWMVEDWETLESNKNIRVDNFAGDWLPSRLKKYLKNGFTILQEQKQEILKRLLEVAEKNANPIKNLIATTDIVSVDDILLFYHRLGDYNEIVEADAYEKGSLGKQEDFALHMFNKKKEQQNV